MLMPIAKRTAVGIFVTGCSGINAGIHFKIEKKGGGDWQGGL